MKKKKAKFKVGQVVMIISGDGTALQPVVFRDYTENGCNVRHAGLVAELPERFIRALTVREIGPR